MTDSNLRNLAVSVISCFKAYDVRGQIGVNFDGDVVNRVARAVAEHFGAANIVIGYDARLTSSFFAEAASQGVIEAKSNVFNIGLAGTEEMYWAVNSLNACAGIEITASHNPIDYNGMKIVKSGAQPLDPERDFKVIKVLAERQIWKKEGRKGAVYFRGVEARSEYVKHVLTFLKLSTLRPLKIVINSGNGAAGPTFDAIASKLDELGAPLEFVRVNHHVDSSFPNGIPNPLLPQNHAATADVVRKEKADFGVAFDGDFDRCFFFDDTGNFVPGEYIVGILASIFLKKEPNARIVHDPRVVWNTRDMVIKNNGTPIQSKTGHAFIKQVMRTHDAIYGGEISAHHYFRDFAYCDSGMIPWLMVAELVSSSKRSLRDWVADCSAVFRSSGEQNFCVRDTETAINQVLSAYLADAISVDKTDGVSLEFNNWRFNLRRSNTEPLVRLNAEMKGGDDGYFLTHLNKIKKILQEN